MKILFDTRKIEDYGIGVCIRNLFQGILNSGNFVCRAIHPKGTDSLDLSEEFSIEVSAKNYDFREHAEIPLKTKKYKEYWYFSPHYVYPLFVSQTTKNDLMEMFCFDESRIKVIHNGIADIFFEKEKMPPFLDFPYVLYTGNLKAHKNLGVLIDAFSLIKDRYPDFRLVLAGVESDRVFRKTLAGSGVEDRIVTKDYLSQEELIRFIDGAEFFVFPSLYEGFGFPPLEAMARKKAVIRSPGGSLREILGG